MPKINFLPKRIINPEVLLPKTYIDLNNKCNLKYHMTSKEIKESILSTKISPDDVVVIYDLGSTVHDSDIPDLIVHLDKAKQVFYIGNDSNSIVKYYEKVYYNMHRVTTMSVPNVTSDLNEFVVYTDEIDKLAMYKFDISNWDNRSFRLKFVEYVGE